MNEVKTTAKDFFLHLAGTVGLYVTAVSLLQLLFSVINYAFPDALDYYVDPYSGAVRWGIAMIVIFFPMYLWLASVVRKNLRMNPEKRELWVRRWLAYLTLFVAGLAVAIDLVTLVNSFLGGEITTRFSLKVLAVLIVAGGVFWNYLSDLRDSETGSGKVFSLGASALVLLSLVAGFLVMGSPSTARDLKFDTRRTEDLSTMQYQIVEYWRTVGTLPGELADIRDEISGYVVPIDPDTGVAYGYTKKSELVFELCATFSQPSVGNGTTPRAVYGLNETWDHEAGRQCFERTIDPERYPQYEDKMVPLKAQ